MLISRRKSRKIILGYLTVPNNIARALGSGRAEGRGRESRDNDRSRARQCDWLRVERTPKPRTVAVPEAGKGQEVASNLEAPEST